LSAPTGRSRLGFYPTKGADVSTVLWIILGALYLMSFVLLGVATLRKGHSMLFFFGIFFPVLWIVGALMGPTEQVSTVESP
jgi:hypothetical protein